MVIVIPVSPFSKKNLLWQYRSHPVKVQHRDLVLDMLSMSAPFHISITDKFNLLTTTVALEIPEACASGILAAPVYVGLTLHSYHITLLHSYLYGAYKQGNKITKALSDYMEERDVTEDDYSQESAYRSWQRYRKALEEQQPFIQKPYSVDMFTAVRPQEALPPYTCITIAQEIHACVAPHVRGRQDKLEQQLKSLVLHDIGKLSKSQIAEALHLTAQQVSYAISTMESWKSVDTMFSMTYDRVVKKHL